MAQATSEQTRGQSLQHENKQPPQKKKIPLAWISATHKRIHIHLPSQEEETQSRSNDLHHEKRGR